jgi:Glycosyltransferase family 87
MTTQKGIPRKKVIYRATIWLLLVVGILLLIRLAPALSKPEYLPVDDFVQSWAGGRLNIHGENPFDAQKIEQLQIAAGGQPSGSYTISIMLNPPWTITLVMPFGLLNYPISRLTWLVLSTILILASSLLLWRIFNGNPRQRWIPILVAFIFAPTISVLEVGQITPVVLIGLTGFLYFITLAKNDWLAGLFLALSTVKPQIVFIFLLAAFFWIIAQRRWLILVSTSLTILFLTIIATLFNPHLLQQYVGLFGTYQVAEWANPTIGAYLRFFLFGVNKFWIQFLPAIFGVVWFLFYWRNHSKEWSWLHASPYLLLASQLTSPYTWTYDMVVLLPVIVQAAVWLSSHWKRWNVVFFSLIFILISLTDLLLHMKLSDFWFIWMVPALLIWYLLVNRIKISGNDGTHVTELVRGKSEQSS